MLEIKCIKCDKILTGHYKRFDTPKLCKDCRAILVTLPCSVCGKISKVYRLEQYYSNTYKNHFCSQSCVMKALHKNDSYVYCETCDTKTKHVIGIGCMTCYNKSESHKQSIIKSIQNKYGEEYINVYQVPEIKEKIVRISLERYNTPNPGNSRKARQKAAITMRGNDNNSRWEDILEQYFIDNNIVYKKQYSDDRYPFPCDFYLPDSDTFIEINGYWSHNDHFYDSNNPNDVEILAKWIEKANKGHKQYANAVQVWSYRDVIKREHAVKNSLNFIVLWTYQDLLNYVKQEVEVKDDNVQNM